MKNIVFPPLSPFSIKKQFPKGFTLVELLVTIAIVAIIGVIALPNMNLFLVKMRVDNEVNEIQRLILTARNTAINSGQNTTLCALKASNSCGSDWGGEISVFMNGSNDINQNSGFNAASDKIIKVKEAVNNDDTLTFNHSRLIFSPTGRLISNNSGTIKYCPKNYPNESRGVEISASGRSYMSADIDNDQKEENRSGTEITCD